MNDRQFIVDYYTRHHLEFVFFIALRIGDEEEAKDLVQELFLRLLDSRQVIMEQTLPNLVVTMAHHAVYDYYRKRRVHEEFEHYLAGNDRSEENAESVISARLLTERMECSLARLPQPCRQVYRLHIYDGMKVSEIAERLQLPYKQVEYRLGQARKVVRRMLRQAV